MHPASVCQLCATASGLCCGADGQGGYLDVCTLAWFPLCSCCHFFPLLMPELSSVLGIGSHVPGKGHPEASPCELAPSVVCEILDKPQRDLDARSEASLQLLCPFALPFSLITYKFRRAKLDFCISFYPREVEPYSTFILPFYNISS